MYPQKFKLTSEDERDVAVMSVCEAEGVSLPNNVFECESLYVELAVHCSEEIHVEVGAEGAGGRSWFLLSPKAARTLADALKLYAGACERVTVPDYFKADV
jgi:hypothetical protein